MSPHLYSVVISFHFKVNWIKQQFRCPVKQTGCHLCVRRLEKIKNRWKNPQHLNMLMKTALMHHNEPCKPAKIPREKY